MSPQEQQAVRKIVTAGMRLMYDKKMFSMLKAGLSKGVPMADKLANETAGLMKLLQDKANGSIPRQLLVPAAAMLMTELAKFMEDSGMPAPTPADIKAAYAKLVPLLAKAIPKPVAARMQPQATPPQPGLIGA